MRDKDMGDFGRSMKRWSPHCPLRGEVDINDRLPISSAAIGPFGHMGAAAFCCNARLRALLYWPRSSHRGKAHEALEIHRAAQW